MTIFMKSHLTRSQVYSIRNLEPHKFAGWAWVPINYLFSLYHGQETVALLFDRQFQSSKGGLVRAANTRWRASRWRNERWGVCYFICIPAHLGVGVIRELCDIDERGPKQCRRCDLQTRQYSRRSPRMRAKINLLTAYRPAQNG